MPYTIESIPEDLDAALQRRATAEGKTVERLIVELLERHLCKECEDERPIREIAGSWVHDPEFDAAMEDFGRIDGEMWR